MRYRLECTKCGKVAGDSAFRCARCNSILEVVYLSGAKPSERFGKSKLGIGGYIEFLPIKSIKKGFECGGTALKHYEDKSQGCKIYLKIETTNPTKTFKDRGSAVEVTKALEIGAREVCCASTGNMGLSVARYSRMAGIKCTIFISKNANPKKIAKIRKEKAAIVEVKGDFNKALDAAEAFAVKRGAFVCGDYHFRKEGQKTVAYEIVEQLGYKVPDLIFVPVGNGTLFSGMYKGLLEFRKAALIDRLPKLIAVQSDECDPVVRAYESSMQVKYVRPKTEADAIAVGYPTFGFESLNAIKATKGGAIRVSEDEIEDAVRLLEKKKIYAELGGGAGFAGALKYIYEHGQKGLVGKRIVVVITGNNEGRFK